MIKKDDNPPNAPDGRIVPIAQIESAISIFSRDNFEVIRIERDGKVSWRKPGEDKLTPVEMDQDLSLAFALAVETMSGLRYSTLMEKIREDAVREYINKKASD